MNETLTADQLAALEKRADEIRKLAAEARDAPFIEQPRNPLADAYACLCAVRHCAETLEKARGFADVGIQESRLALERQASAPAAELASGCTTDGVPYEVVDWIDRLAVAIQDDIRKDIKHTCQQHFNGRHKELVEDWGSDDPNRGYWHGSHWIGKIIEKHLQSIPVSALRQPAAPAAEHGQRLAKCGHVAYRHHDNMCIQDGCPHAAYVAMNGPEFPGDGDEQGKPIVVDGRVCEFCRVRAGRGDAQGRWYISTEHADFSGYLWLSGKWHMDFDALSTWPTEAAAIEFARSVADKTQEQANGAKRGG